MPLYLIVTLIARTGFSTSNYLEEGLNSNTFIANAENYEDQIAGDHLKFVDRASIPSKVISDPFLELFIVYGSGIENDVFYFNPELKPEKDNRGLYAAFQSGTIDGRERSKKMSTYLSTLESMYRLKIDSTEVDFDLVFTHNKKETTRVSGRFGFKGI